MIYNFGEKIRTIRERKKMTMKDIAKKAGVSESLISQIERNKTSPAIDTLLKISDVLDIDLEHLFSGFKKTKKVHIVPSRGRNRMNIKGVLFEQLSGIKPEDSLSGIEAYFLKIGQGMEKGNKEYGHIGSELGIIIKGNGIFKYGTESYALKPGDSISFESDIPHSLKNTGKDSLEAYWVLTPPKNVFAEL